MAAIDLPVPGSDFNTWGEKLNTAVNTVHDEASDATVAGYVPGPGPTSDALDVKIEGRVVRGNPGEGYGVVAGVIRQTTQAGGWEIIIPDPGNPASNHVPINLDNVTKSLADRIVIQYGALGAVGTGSLVVVTDETYAGMGIHVGASVGRDLATIQAFKRVHLADRVYWNGSAWATGSGAADSFANFSFVSGVLTMTHPAIEDNNTVALTPRGSAYRAVVSGGSAPVGLGTLRIQFLDATGTVVTTPDTSCEVYIDRGTRMKEILADDLYSAGGNLWIYGVFPLTEVHPDA